MNRRHLTTEADRLHAHIRSALAGQPEHVIDAAIETADAIHKDGAGPMQRALDAALTHARRTPPQKAAA
jgi:hypothetical protein